jgi:adenosylcobinamide-GDP ribazoletransferase
MTDPAADPAPNRDTPAAWWRDLTVAFGVLTTWRAELDPPVDAAAIRHAGRAFPLVGLLLGLVAAALYGFGMSLKLGPAVSAALAVAVLILVSGGRGEIGLAVYVEALARSDDPERRRALMAEAPFGYAGTIVLVLSLLLRIFLVAWLISGREVAPALIAALVASRAALALFAAPPAEAATGTGADPILDPAPPDGSPWWLTAALAAALILLFLGPLAGLVACVVGLVAGWMASVIVHGQCERMTGPGQGVVQHAVEIAVLGAAVAAS